MSPNKKFALDISKGEYKIPLLANATYEKYFKLQTSLLANSKTHDYHFNFHHGRHGNKTREHELPIQYAINTNYLVFWSCTKLLSIDLHKFDH